jgi:hypothetical protein
MRFILIVPFIFLFQHFYGQPLSIKNYEDELYTKSIDTLVSMVLSKYPDVQIVICCPNYIHEMIPDSFHNHQVIKSEKFKGKRKFEGAIWIKMDPNDSNKDTVAIFTTIRRQTKRQMLAWEYPSQVINYTLIYKIHSDNRTYELVGIKEGMFIY